MSDPHTTTNYLLLLSLSHTNIIFPPFLLPMTNAAIASFFSDIGENIEAALGKLEDLASAPKPEGFLKLRNLLAKKEKDAGPELNYELGKYAKKAYELVEKRANNVQASLGDFLEGVLGEDWAKEIPEEWKLDVPLFDESAKEELSIPDYTKLLTDSQKSFEKIMDAENFDEIYGELEDIESKFCTKEDFIKPEKVPTTCYGPTVSLALAPKVCVIDDKDKQVTCDPAKLVLTKSPGYCELKHKTPFEFYGKECKLEKEFGTEKDAEIGGREFVVPLGDVDFKGIKTEVEKLVSELPIPTPESVDELLKLVF